MFHKDYCPFTSHNPVLTAFLQITLLVLIDFWAFGLKVAPLNPTSSSLRQYPAQSTPLNYR